MLRVYGRCAVEASRFLGLSSSLAKRSYSEQEVRKSERAFQSVQRDEPFGKKSNGVFHTMGPDEQWKKKALNLIFSGRKYSDFTLEEKKIVDSLQESVQKVDGGVILPNTGADLEQREIEQLLRSRDKQDG